MKCTLNILCALTTIGCVSAAEAGYRYTVTASCFGTNPGAATIDIKYFETDPGYSNKSCKEALNNLKRICRETAKKDGYPAANVYDDYVITSKSASQSNGSQSSSGHSGGGSLLLLGGFSSSNSSNGEFHGSSQSATAQPVEVNLENDCETDTDIPQSNKPLYQSTEYMGE